MVKTRKKRRGPARGVKMSRKLYDALVMSTSTLVRAYANGLANGGSVKWSEVDRAHEHAIRAQRQLLRSERRK